MEVGEDRKDRFRRRLDARRALNAKGIRPGRGESQQIDDGDGREHDSSLSPGLLNEVR